MIGGPLETIAHYHAAHYQRTPQSLLRMGNAVLTDYDVGGEIVEKAHPSCWLAFKDIHAEKFHLFSFCKINFKPLLQIRRDRQLKYLSP